MSYNKHMLDQSYLPQSQYNEAVLSTRHNGANAHLTGSSLENRPDRLAHVRRRIAAQHAEDLIVRARMSQTLLIPPGKLTNDTSGKYLTTEHTSASLHISNVNGASLTLSFGCDFCDNPDLVCTCPSCN